MLAKRQIIADEGPIAVLLALDGDRTGAQRMIEQMMADADGTSALWQGRALNWRGQVYQSEKNYRAAVESYEKAIAIWASDTLVKNTPLYEVERRETDARLTECRRLLQ